MQLGVLFFFLMAGFCLELVAKKSKTTRIASIVLIITGCLSAFFWNFLTSIVR